MENNALNDTICAISTPAGVGGIAVIRVSGKNASAMVASLLQNKHGKKVSLADRKATFCCLYAGSEFIDEVVATCFNAPNSYTGEDVVEISCHGSTYIQSRILNTLIDAGCRLAKPGEFTLRAFLNHKLNLSQAEAVADLIDSQSEAAHRLAISQMRGGYALELEQLRQQLIDLSALLELELDFSDEDLQFASRQHICDLLDELSQKVERLMNTFQTGNALKNGIPVAIIGAPNAGKSSLLNALLNEQRAIVSPIAGTTRDTIEETMNIDGILFRFIDTAGLHHSDDTLENMGLERSVNAARQAQVVLLVRDITLPHDGDAVCEIAHFTDLSTLDGKHLIVVNNKCDQPHANTSSGVEVSAKEGIGIDKLKHAIAESVKDDANQNQGVLLTNARHFEAMKHIVDALGEVRKSLDAQLSSDLVVIDLRDALYHLGTITGSVTNDDILGSIFSKFCIGK